MFKTFQYPDVMGEATTIRPPHSALFLLNSLDRYNTGAVNLPFDTNPTNPNNLVISTGKQFAMGKVKRIALTNLNFPLVTPNVNIVNNRFYITYNTVSYFIIVPEAFYTGSALATAIQNQMNQTSGGLGWFAVASTTYNQGILLPTASTAWTVTFNTNGSFTFGNSAINTITTTVRPITSYSAYTDNNNNIVDVNGNVISNGTIYKNLNQITGFNYGFVAPASNTWTGGVASLSYTRYVDFVSSKICKYQNTKDSQTLQNTTDIIYRLYLDSSINLTGNSNYLFCAPAVNMNIDITNPKFIEWNPDEYLSSVDIQLVDDIGQPLYIPNLNWGSNYLMTFLVLDS